MTDDALLQEYVKHRSEAAFTELVNRHMATVYASALRQTRRPDLAQEVTQAVFILLARKAATFKPGVVLGGWLFRATHFAANDLMKAEFRRQCRETLAYQSDTALRGETQVPADPEPDPWTEIAPVLDASLARLSEGDRHALILRFFEGRSLAEVGQALGVAEDAARKRVTRAVDRLRSLLAGTGSRLGPEVLPALLAERTRPEPPTGLRAATVAAALALPGLGPSSAEGLSLAVARKLFWLQARWWAAVGTATALGMAGVAAGWQAWQRSDSTVRSAAVNPAEYRPAGFPDAAPVHRFLADLQDRAAARDAAAIAGWVRFPLRVNSQHGSRWINDATEFRSAFEATFNHQVISMILKCPRTGLYCDARGIMIGAGEAWLGPADAAAGNFEPRIIALNLD